MPNRLPLIFTPSLGIPHGTLLGLAAAVGQARGRAHLKLMDFFFVSHDWSAGQSNAPWHRYQKKWPALWSGPYDENNWFPFVFGQLLNPYFWGADLPGVNLASRKITADTDIEPDSPKWWFSKKNRDSHTSTLKLQAFKTVSPAIFVYKTQDSPNKKPFKSQTSSMNGKVSLKFHGGHGFGQKKNISPTKISLK